MKQSLSGHYSVWGIKGEEFPHGANMQQQLKFFLGYAILAPSTHNTQPWNFQVTDDTVIFYINPKRVLPASDPHGREAYVSMGACIENFLIAARAFGFIDMIEFADHLQSNPHSCDEPFEVCRIKFQHDPKRLNHEDHLFNAISKRRSFRLPFINNPLDPVINNRLKNLINDLVKIDIFEDDIHKQHAAEAVASGTVEAFKNPEFGKELSGWLHHNWKKTPLGMPGFTVGMPGPVSLIVPRLLAAVNMGKSQAKMMKSVVLKTPSFGVVHGLEDNPQTWLEAGKLAQRAALILTSSGLATSLMGAPVEFDSVAHKLQQDLSLSGRPIVFFRIGKSKKEAPYSPRCKVDECLI